MTLEKNQNSLNPYWSYKAPSLKALAYLLQKRSSCYFAERMHQKKTSAKMFCKIWYAHFTL